MNNSKKIGSINMNNSKKIGSINMNNSKKIGSINMNNSKKIGSINMNNSKKIGSINMNNSKKIGICIHNYSKIPAPICQKCVIYCAGKCGLCSICYAIKYNKFVSENISYSPQYDYIVDNLVIEN